MSINIKTGEIITDKSSVHDISEAYKQCLLRQKELEQISDELKKYIQPHIENAVKNEEKTLDGFWSVVKGAKRFSVEAFNELAPRSIKSKYKGLKQEIKDLEDYFKLDGKPYVKFPKL